jgi:hypothetical protein
MQDGVPPHFALPVCAWLDNHFSGGWIGRRGPTEWSSRSSCISPFDLFFMGLGERGNQEHLMNWNNKFEIFSFLFD